MSIRKIFLQVKVSPAVGDFLDADQPAQSAQLRRMARVCLVLHLSITMGATPYISWYTSMHRGACSIADSPKGKGVCVCGIVSGMPKHHTSQIEFTPQCREADLEETIMKHHAAKELEQIDGSSLQCCFASGLQLLLLLLEEQPGHRYAWTTAERALYERGPGGQATWLAEASVLPEQHTVAVQQGAVPVLWLVRKL